ncbi:hypothetical protein [Paenibacillus polymyxa]|uniref:hypothetical protein n=1 Tax=Paenibacillus polymyxa TaxID=1406 RepID=UPI002ED30177
MDERVLKIDVSPKMAYESKGTFYEFPHSEFNEEYPQIYHTNLCCSFNGTNGYGMYIDARGRNQWKEKMGDSWFCWLDTIDDDYAVIGERADRIVNEDIAVYMSH